MEKLICCIIKSNPDVEEEYRLKYITGGLMSTAELSVLEAKKEINLYAQRSHRMFRMVQSLLHTAKMDEFNKLYYDNLVSYCEIESKKD